jgi:hypothetical protein
MKKIFLLTAVIIAVCACKKEPEKLQLAGGTWVATDNSTYICFYPDKMYFKDWENVTLYICDTQITTTYTIDNINDTFQEFSFTLYNFIYKDSAYPNTYTGRLYLWSPYISSNDSSKIYLASKRAMSGAEIYRKQ